MKSRPFAASRVWLWSLFFLTLGNAFAAQTGTRFSSFRYLMNKEVYLQFSAPTGFNYRVDVSTNLTSWVSMVSFPLTNTSFQHTDAAAPYQPLRFYFARQLAGSNIVTGDHLPTTNGDVVIRTLIHAGAVLAWNGKTIYVDVTNQNLGLPRADLILLTHGHADHVNTTSLTAVTNPNTTILASGWAWSNLTASLKSLTTVLTNGGSTNVLGIRIEAVAMYNTNAGPAHPKGLGNGYILNIADRRIYFSGDTDNTPELRVLTNLDVAFIAMRGPAANMTMAEAVNVMRIVRPKVIYPYHYGTYDPNTFKQQLGTDLGLEVRLRKWY